MPKPIRRDYQTDLVHGVYRSWNAGHRNVIAVLPTGGGKTKTFASMIDELQGPIVIAAHRKELVGQISLAVAEFEVPHRIIASTGTLKNCINRHIGLLKRSYHDPRARVTIASVDTINAQADSLGQWAAQQAYWITDEAHHCASGNKWSKMIELFVNARGLGVTATPIRADRKTLARVQGGIFDDMVIGPSMREMIDHGHLCDYVIYAPPMSLNLHNLKIGASGDYTQDSVRKEAHRSQIVGDIVHHYQRFAAGKRTIVFAVDVEQSIELAQRFVDAGFRAAAVDGTTPEAVRDLTIDKFSRGAIDILVNVDLFGEGFDVPAVECVIMGRPTQSLGLYMQQFGRALRPLPGKPHGIIIDAVGNVQFHGLPDRPRQWSLIGEERGRRRERDPEAIPVTSCSACMRTRESILRACPFCGHVEEPAGRSLPEQVAGDLQMLDPATLRVMRGEIERVDGPPQVPRNLVGTPAEKALICNWQERQVAQDGLRQSIATWAGIWHAAGEDDATIQRRFYFRFGTDVMTAQTLGVKDAEALAIDIQTALERHFADRVA